MQMILNAIAKQFTLKDDGQIYFQSDSTNPLPGDAIAQLVKGDNLLQPDVQFMLPADQNNDEVKTFVTNWMKAHLCTVLSPLVAMLDGNDTPDIVRSIFIRLFQNLGIMKRGDLDDLISQLDPEQRKIIRQKKVKLGPILVFLPELNKPAAVRVRGLLWALYNDKSLPAPCPRDGAVSQKIDPETVNKDFYQCIGYPVYADRAIRIDMVDRVMSAIYDSADKGKFRAQHAYAEWMGCGIPDMYAILAAMGHKHIEPVVTIETTIDVIESVEATITADEAVATSPMPTVDEVTAETETENTETETENTEIEMPATAEVETPRQKAKPELDEFFLRKGAAHRDRAPRREFTPRERNNNGNNSNNNDNGSQFENRNFGNGDRPKSHNKSHGQSQGGKSFNKPDATPKTATEKFAEKFGNKFEKKSDGKFGNKFASKSGGKSDGKFDGSKGRTGGDRDDRGQRPKYNNKDRAPRSDEPRVFSAEAKTSDNPFAILGQLKSS